MKKEIKILVFPDRSGNYPEVKKDDVMRVIDLEEFGDGKHFSVTKTTFVGGKNSLIEIAAKQNFTTNLFLWNNPPEEEMEQITRYKMPSNVKIFHVNHEIKKQKKDQSDLYFEKLELLSRKKKAVM